MKMTAFRCLDHPELLLVLAQSALSLGLAQPSLDLGLTHPGLELKMIAFHIMAQS